LVQEPQILLLDEPTSSLDLGHQQAVLELVDEVRRAAGLTVIAAMHDLTLAAQYGDRILLLQNGRVEACGTPADVLTSARIAEVYAARAAVVAIDNNQVIAPIRFDAREIGA
jgi:iron complex transport system ATP-binding protein